jgi:hypothetical protein
MLMSVASTAAENHDDVSGV